ncbi:HlyD family type I secretion periplasmic adaptor subunit [Caulobacter sp. KR2-114]|uniref:HlyD family type I secretion periplasmic adaptor subunit n=1 Tax=Caulobacter sp. KR2-114 TaxID=3400912 RepID=UPI003C066361
MTANLSGQGGGLGGGLGDWSRRMWARAVRAVRGEDAAADELAASPRRQIAAGLVAVAVFLLILLGWGALARLDAGVYAQGVVAVSGSRQSVQHKDGGVVAELDVREGDEVKAGQVLLKLSATELHASERATADQIFQLEALQARLLAEINGAPAIAWPADFAEQTGPDRDSAQNAMRIQQREFDARRAELSTQQAVLRQRERQLDDEIDGYRRQVEANKLEQGLIQDEISSLDSLLKKGLVPMSRMRALQRSAAELTGSYGEYNASIAKTQQQIGETRLQSSDLERQRVADVSREYRDAQMPLSEARPKLAAIREQIERATIRAPATGRVMGLSIFTVGGVVAPGQKLLDIVPDAAPLVIDARIKPNDASDLRPGQVTEIRIPAFHDRRMPLLNGVISKISADSFVDEKAGTAYFRAEVTVPASELRLIRDERGELGGLRPGLPVEVVVPQRPRTALDYLVEPLKRMLWKSFRDG